MYGTYSLICFITLLRMLLTISSYKKAPGYDLITGSLLKELYRKGISVLTNLFNAVLRLKYFPVQWKVTEIVSKP